MNKLIDKPIDSLTLAAGQCCTRHVRQGSLIIARRGDLLLRCPPQWLGEHLLRNEIRLAEGEACRLADSGWIDLIASSDAQVLIDSPASGWRNWLRRVRGWLMLRQIGVG